MTPRRRVVVEPRTILVWSTPMLPANVEAALRVALSHLKRLADVRYAEVRYVAEETEKLRVKDGRPERAATARTRGAGIRVLGARAWGFACSARLDEAGLVEAAESAARVARASGRLAKEPILFPERAPAAGIYATRLAIDPFLVPLEDKLRELDAPVRVLLAGGAPVRSAEAWMEFRRVHKHLFTTEGTEVEQALTYGACGMHVIAASDSGLVEKRSYPTWRGGDGFQGGYERVRELGLAARAPELRDEVVALLSAPPCPEGPRDLVLASDQVALQIHESCGHAAELDRALGEEVPRGGGSFLKPHDLGTFRYGAPIVDVVADATSDGGMGTFGWDDEGTPAAARPIVREGCFVDYLSGREGAASLGRPSTGAMRAETWNRPPLVRMTNVSLEPRGGTLDDLVADTRDGVLVCTPVAHGGISGHHVQRGFGVNDLRLHFELSCEIAWEIKRGKRTRVLRNPVYAGATPDFWRSCNAICGRDAWRLWGIEACAKGDPPQLLPVGHGAAPARFRNAVIGSSRERAGGAS